MNKIKLFLILIVVFTSFSSFSQTQKEWTLEQCIDYALEHNIQLKQQLINTEYNKNTLNQSKWDYLPSLNGSSSANFSSGRSVDPYTYQFTENNVTSYNFSVGSSMVLFAGFQKWNTMAVNKFNLLASLQDQEKFKNDIALNISAAYLQILFAEEFLGIAENQLDITKQQVKLTQKLVNAGSLPEGSLLEVQAQEANEEAQLVGSQNQLDMAYLTLQQLMDLEVGEEIRIVHPDIDNFDEGRILQTVSSIYEEALLSLPQIKSADLKLKSAEKSLSVARSSYYPRLSLNGSIYTGYSNNRKLYSIVPITYPSQLIGYTSEGIDVFSFESIGQSYTESNYAFNDQFNDNAYKSLSLSLSIPIFNKLQARYGVRNSKLNVLNTKLSRDMERNQLYKEIQQAHADAVAALKKYKASVKSLTAIEEAFHYTQQKFEVGLINLVDFNIAKNNFIKVQSDVLQAKYEFVFKSNILQFYRGVPISY